MTIEEIISKAEEESNKKLINLTKTIAYATQQTYVKAMNDIYKDVGTGKEDHFTAYKKVVDQLTKNGVTLIAKDGRKEKLEVVVRRGLFGSLHQTANEIAKKVGEDIDYNCVVIGHSSTCRPSHNVIDDVVMSKKEFEKYEYLTEEYGCNHVVNYDWREEFEGVDDRMDYGNEHITDEECERNYKIQQGARYYERVARAKKNVIERGDTSNKAKQELRNAQSKYRIYCNKNGLKVDYKRTWKSGYTKSINYAISSRLNNIHVNSKLSSQDQQKIIDKYLTEENIKYITDKNKYISYDSNINKIIINIDNLKSIIDNYDSYKMFIHEVTHMLDERTKFTKNNYDVIMTYIDNANKYIMKNKNKYIEMFNKDKYNLNMDLSTIFASITKTKISGSYAHPVSYWNSKYTQSYEIVASLANIKIANDIEALKIINEIPQIKILYKKVSDWVDSDF